MGSFVSNTIHIKMKAYKYIKMNLYYYHYKKTYFLRWQYSRLIRRKRGGYDELTSKDVSLLNVHRNGGFVVKDSLCLRRNKFLVERKERFRRKRHVTLHGKAHVMHSM